MRAVPSWDPEAETFESIALDIARFQYDYSPGFARLAKAHGRTLSTISDLPKLPTDAFRYTRVAVHPPDLDRALFKTSGTTNDPGLHPVRDLSTKETLALLSARSSLFENTSRGVVVALASVPTSPHESSLGHMMELFMRSFDGRSLTPDPEGAAFDSRAPPRWLATATGVDVEGLARAARIAIHRSEPLTVLSTSFALLALLEEVDGARVKTPTRTRVMLTGGFKGRRTESNEEDIRRRAASAFQTSPAHIIGEYGMTELSSQLFEAPGTRRYVPPPWLKVSAVDPTTRDTLPHGKPGLAHFIDLANVDSCLSVLTQDLIITHEDGVELIGRAPRAIPRGCSLPYEPLIGFTP